MKKLVSILVVAALLGVFLMSSVLATEDPQIVVSSVEAVGGEEVRLTVSLVNNPGITNGNLEVTYDETALELVEIDCETETTWRGMIMASGKKVSFVNASNTSKDHLMFEIVLKVKEDAPGGDHEVGINVNYILNNAEEEIEFTVVPGVVSVHVCDPVPVEGIPATIYSEGLKAHGKCSCGKLYIDGVEVTEEDLVIPMLGQVVVSSANAYNGDEVRLTVSLVNNPGITNGLFVVTYDETAMELVEIDCETESTWRGMIMAQDNKVSFVNTSDTNKDHLMFEIVLKVKDDAVGGDYEVGINIEYLLNNAEEDVGFATFPGTVSVHVCQPAHAVCENLVEVTCTTDGGYDEVVYCSDCGKELSRTRIVVSAPGHVPGNTVVENAVEPTCTTDGGYDEVVYCTVCGEELSRASFIVAAPGHDYESVVTEPTCTEDGYTTHTCHCGDTYVDSVVEATGHEMGGWYEYRASTGTVKGEARCECQHCDYYESETLYLLGDVNHDDKVNTTDAKLIMQLELGMVDENAIDLSLADVNGDGKYNTTDAKLVMQLELGMIPDFTD